MKHSDNVDALFAALAKAQIEMKPAAKNAKNPFFNSSYADLASIWEACREPLAKNGISILQIPELTSDGKLILETIIAHSSGQWISGVYPINPIKTDPQSLGSAVSYSRRYSLSAMVGVVTEDDDGNLASQKASDHPPSKTNPQPPTEKAPPPAKPKPLGSNLSPKGRSLLEAGMPKEWKLPELREMLDADFGVKEPEKLNDQEFAGALLTLRQLTHREWRRRRNVPPVV